MSSSSTRIAESWRQNRSPSGNRVKHRGQTFTLFSEAGLYEEGQEAVVDRALTLGWLDVEQGELEADVELLARRELDPAGDRDLEVAGVGVEVHDPQLSKHHQRELGDRVGRDADRRVEVGRGLVAAGLVEVDAHQGLQRDDRELRLDVVAEREAEIERELG